MAVLQALTSIAAYSNSAWISTDGNSNIAVNAGDGNHTVEIRSSASGIVSSSELYNSLPRQTMVAKAFETRVCNKSDHAINYEMTA